jgi:hypothetical protein
VLVRGLAVAATGNRRYMTLAFAGLRPGDKSPLEPAPPTIRELIAAK